MQDFPKGSRIFGKKIGRLAACAKGLARGRLNEGFEKETAG
jgi:hypothetical protein